MKWLKKFENYHRSIYISPDKLEDIFTHITDLGFTLTSVMPIRESKECDKCDTSGSINCTRCKGKKNIECKSCNSKGEIQCKECDGQGDIDCCNSKLQEYVLEMMVKNPSAKLKQLSDQYMDIQTESFKKGFKHSDMYSGDFRNYRGTVSTYIWYLYGLAYKKYDNETKADEMPTPDDDKYKHSITFDLNDEYDSWNSPYGDYIKTYKKFKDFDRNLLDEIKTRLYIEAGKFSDKVSKKFKFCDKCKDSNNNGYRDCKKCEGAGSLICKKCNGDSGVCHDCNRDGKITCVKCEGEGYFDIGAYSIKYRYTKKLDGYSSSREIIKKQKVLLSELDDACDAIERILKRYNYESEFDYTQGSNSIVLDFTISNIEDKELISNIISREKNGDIIDLNDIFADLNNDEDEN